MLRNADFVCFCRFACCTILLTTLQAERKACTSRPDFNQSLCSPPLALGLKKLRTDGTEPGRRRAAGNLALRQGRTDPGGSAVGDAVAQLKMWCRSEGETEGGLDLHCMGWRLEDVELSQDREVIGLESRTGAGRWEDVVVFPVNNPVKNVTRSVSGSGD